MNYKKYFCLMALLLLAVARTASAQPAEEKELVYAIQNRIFDRHHEIGFVLGFIPNDDFYYGYPVGFSYTYHLNENVAWEVARGQWFFNNEKDLKQDLEKDFGVTPTHFDEMKLMLHSNLILKPSYGKDALWNKTVINHETYLLAGIGMVSYDRHFSTGKDGSEQAVSLSFGLGRKYFLNKKFAVNLEFRDYVNFKEADTENIVYLGVGLCYRFDLAPRKAARETAVENFKRYLKEND
jgi:outer membrane beta-barrel protein